MGDLSDLAGALRPADSTVPAEWLKGEVVAVNDGSPLSISLRLGGSPVVIPRVPVISTYAPVVGDAVWVVRSGPLLVAIAAGHAPQLPEGGPLVTVQDEGVTVGTRSVVNFLGAGVVAADNPGAGRVDVTVAGGGGGGDPDSRFHSGFWYAVGNRAAGASITANTLEAYPWLVGQAITLAEIVAFATDSLTNGTLRVGLYRDSGSGTPQSLVSEFGSMPSGGSGAFKSLSVNVPLSPDWYWLAWVQQGSSDPSWAQVASPPSSPYLGALASTDNIRPFGYQYNGSVAGALPASWSSTIVNKAVYQPWINLRIA